MPAIICRRQKVPNKPENCGFARPIVAVKEDKALCNSVLYGSASL